MRHFSVFRSSSTRLAAIAFGLFLSISFLSRILLALKSIQDVTWDLSLLGSFVCGAFFDVAAGLFAAGLWLVIGFMFPARWIKTRSGQGFIAGLMIVYASLLIFITTSEWFFWDEFGVRFNFIAVDYLIWTQEVLGNIRESYPMVPISLGIVTIGAGIVWLFMVKGAFRWIAAGETAWPVRLGSAMAGLALSTAAYLFVEQGALPLFSNQYHAELAKNGCWSFFSAYDQMELDYNKWYPKVSQDEALTATKSILVTANETPTTPSPLDFRRTINGRGPERRWNVILICMESFGADYMSFTGNTKGISPNLDRLANESIFFENLYATGTRTVRGMEALTLNIPPTPGASILYRPQGTNLITTFSPFLKRGYDCGFFYGGDGDFDYMNRFFSTSGARIMDINAWEDQDTTFKTSWGSCDEDLFNKTISEADKAYAKGTNFHYFCMTTSNHRPYDFPQGRIDLRPKIDSKAEVKYADWAVGQLLENASTRPWFKDTLFVFCADHCSNSAGKAELNVKKYHIPGMIYNPGLVQPRKINALSSQIDVMPTVFGLLNWNYETLGFGYDRLAPASNTLPQRAFISNYQKIALLRPDGLAILKPGKPPSLYDCNLVTGNLTAADPIHKSDLLHQTIVLYQSASWLFNSGGLKDPTKP